MAEPRARIVYKVRNRRQCLTDLAADVFKNVSAHIGREFFEECNSAIFGSYTAKKSLASLSTKDALFALGDKESWTVETLVQSLIRADNRLALRELVSFWPAHFVRKPDLVVTVADDEDLVVEADAAGIPAPRISWFDPTNRHVGNGNELYMDHFSEGFYTVVAQNEFKQQKGVERHVFQVHRFRPAAVPSMPETGSSTSGRQLHDLAHLNPDSVKPKGCPHVATRKVALLIGMTAYSPDFYKPLAGALTDLPALAKALTSIDFEVLTLLDLPMDDLRRAIDIYSQLLDAGVYSFVYFSGHGQRFKDDDDFLVPVDAPVDAQETDCLSRKETICLLQRSSPAFNLVVWDACRKPGPEQPNSTDQQQQQQTAANYQYREQNLYQFCSAVAFDEAFEIADDVRSSSLTVLMFLDLFKQGPKDIPTFLKEWSTLIYDQVLQRQGHDLQMRPYFTSSDPRLSLWDPVVPEGTTTTTTDPSSLKSHILDIWNSRTNLDTNGVYALPQVDLDPHLDAIGVFVRPEFYMHNVLRLSVSLLDNSSRRRVGILKEKMDRYVAEDFVDGVQLNSPKWSGLRYKEPVVEGIDVWRRLYVYHLQRLEESPGRRGPAHSLRVPIAVLEASGEWWEATATLQDVYIFRLFSVMRAEGRAPN